MQYMDNKTITLIYQMETRIGLLALMYSSLKGKKDYVITGYILWQKIKSYGWKRVNLNAGFQSYSRTAHFLPLGQSDY